MNPITTVSYSRILDDSDTWIGSLASAGNNSAVDRFATVLAAEVDLVGGSSNGSRGTSQVYGGWVQDVLVPDALGSYQNNHQEVVIFASNVSAVAQPPYFKPNPPSNDPAPVPLSGPLLDALTAAPGTCGNTSLLPGNQQGLSIELLSPLGILPDPPPSLGRRILFTAVDDPSMPFLAQYPIAGSHLTDIRYNLDFISYLTLWSSATGTPNDMGTPPPNGSLAECTYRALLRQPWSIRSEFHNIDAEGRVAGSSSSTIALGSAVMYPSIMPISSTPAVLTPPTGQKSTAYNFQH